MSAKKRVAPDFDKLLGGSDVKMDREAVSGPQAIEASVKETAGQSGKAESNPAPGPEASTEAEQAPEAPAPVPAASTPKQTVLSEYTVRPAPQRKKPAPIYDYERIDNSSDIEGTWIQTNVKMHPGVRTSYSQAIKVLKAQGVRTTGRQFVYEAMNAKFLTMAPFNEYTQRLHDEAGTEHARKPEDRPDETAEQWRPPVKE